MNKLRSDSTWAALTPAQKETLIQWLFADNLAYDEILQRVKNDFGLDASKTSLGRYYQTLARERLREELAEAQATAAEAQAAEVSLSLLRGAALKMVGKKLIDCALKPGAARELPTLANLILLSEQHEIQREWLALARDRFEFKAAKATLKALPIMDDLAREDDARETARIEAIKLKLFGRRLLSLIEQPNPDESSTPQYAHPSVQKSP